MAKDKRENKSRGRFRGAEVGATAKVGWRSRKRRKVGVKEEEERNWSRKEEECVEKKQK